ncbi:allantoinase [Actinophytocola xinjiangensis]|uniref:allantoinase n=1 Tax=Actinophytocola xinjiangensis TaxID=485602 RepID=A0A7Z0WMH4_9PSEU|nr:allantoinase AllB [Actinophytocola xinjiangensis]OLF08432.1 allantoinase [Actinophytocola xinjiangensis]
MTDTVFRASRILTPDGEVAGWVAVDDGVITEISDSPLTGRDTVELADDEVLLPGLVDTHVHVNDPGRTEWEGFETATRAAAAGGITTLVDMPLNSVPPTTDLAALAVKRATARGRVHVDVGFWGGAVPGNLGDLVALHEAGVFGFKCFLPPSGVDEFANLAPDELAAVLRLLHGIGALTIVHAEDPARITEATGRHYADFLASRPRAAENTAIAQLVSLASAADARVHVLHLSSAEALPVIAAARRDGVAITAETCPHYLTLRAEDVPDGATEFKCCPPIREAANQDLLWQGLADGTIDCVVSDHSPSTADLKRFDTGDFGAAWGGIAGLQLGLPAMWTEARARGVPLERVVGWMSAAPADLVGLRRKGRLAVGHDADLCVFAPEHSFTVDAGRLHHRNPVSAYHGRTLTGVVRSTWLRGEPVTGRPRGRLLVRGLA